MCALVLKKWNACLLKTRLLIQAMMMKQWRFSVSILLRSDVGGPSWKSNTMFHLDTLSIELRVSHARDSVESEDVRCGSLVERTRTRSSRWITASQCLMVLQMTKLRT